MEIVFALLGILFALALATNEQTKILKKEIENEEK
jgi:hypothetical protein